MMDIDTWVGNCKVRVMELDDSSYFLHLQYYNSGQSLVKPPSWERTYFIKKTENAEWFIKNRLNSIVSHLELNGRIPNRSVLSFGFVSEICTHCDKYIEV